MVLIRVTAQTLCNCGDAHSVYDVRKIDKRRKTKIVNYIDAHFYNLIILSRKLMKMFCNVRMTIFVCISVFGQFLWAFQWHNNKDNDPQIFERNLLRSIVDRMNKDYSSSYSDINQSDLPLRTRLTSVKVEEDEPNYSYITVDDGPIIPSLRDNEYLQHSFPWDHQYMTGGAGEGKQNLTPEGMVTSKNEVKTDALLPAYCNPPNPCPVGFTAEDGCIQHFENTAGFSREYQAAQKCMCDSEHMFDCPSTHEFTYDNDLDFERLVGQEKDVNTKKGFPSEIFNPYLEGEMLPIAAKKGINVGF